MKTWGLTAAFLGLSVGLVSLLLRFRLLLLEPFTGLVSAAVRSLFEPLWALAFAAWLIGTGIRPRPAP